jgi:hypothetical protein
MRCCFGAALLRPNGLCGHTAVPLVLPPQHGGDARRRRCTRRWHSRICSSSCRFGWVSGTLGRPCHRLTRHPARSCTRSAVRGTAHAVGLSRSASVVQWRSLYGH